MTEDDETDEPRRRPRPDRDRAPEFDDDEDEPRRRRRRRRRAPDPLDDPAMRFVLPVNTSALSIAAGYAGLFAVLCIPAPLALILGILAVMQLKKNPKLHGYGRAYFGIVMGILFTVVPVILLIISAVSK